jgi:hypothetical protein
MPPLPEDITPQLRDFLVRCFEKARPGAGKHTAAQPHQARLAAAQAAQLS